MTEIHADRLAIAMRSGLLVGQHDQNDDAQFCVMEAVAYVAGEPWSDSPQCACPVISAFLRVWNDALPSAERTTLLRGLIPRLVGTRSTPAVENRRSMMAADWLIRTYTPAWLKLADLGAQADLLAALPEITDMSQVPSIRGSIEAVRRDAAVATAAAAAATWDATWDAAWDATWDAAWDAAGDAAGTAAGTAAAEAAWDAAAEAAWAAAGDAAGTAAWDAAGTAAAAAATAAAWAKLEPTKIKLQKSALDLVNRMIDVKETP